MIKEVLDVMTALAGEGRTMVCVTHEMGFAREADDRILVMEQGRIIEDERPADFFAAPNSERAGTFSDLIHSQRVAEMPARPDRDAAGPVLSGASQLERESRGDRRC